MFQSYFWIKLIKKLNELMTTLLEIEKDTGSGRTRAENSDKLQGSIFIP